MKKNKIVILLLALLVLAPTLLHAQIIKGEVFVGGNVSQVDGDECYGFRKFGVHAGVGALVPIATFSSVSLDFGLEALFSQRGAYKRDANNPHLGLYSGKYKLNLNYAEIPVMFYVTDKERGVVKCRYCGKEQLIENIKLV